MFCHCLRIKDFFYWWKNNLQIKTAKVLLLLPGGAEFWDVFCVFEVSPGCSRIKLCALQSAVSCGAHLSWMQFIQTLWPSSVAPSPRHPSPPADCTTCCVLQITQTRQSLLLWRAHKNTRVLLKRFCDARAVLLLGWWSRTMHCLTSTLSPTTGEKKKRKIMTIEKKRLHIVSMATTLSSSFTLSIILSGCSALQRRCSDQIYSNFECFTYRLFFVSFVTFCFIFALWILQGKQLFTFVNIYFLWKKVFSQSFWICERQFCFHIILHTEVFHRVQLNNTKKVQVTWT